MTKFYKKILTVTVALVLTVSGFAAPEIVKTMSLGDGISTNGIVRVVVKLTDDAIGPDIGFTLHEAEPAAPWNDAMAIGMFDFIKNSNGGIHLAGYNAGTWDWDNNVKAVETNKNLVLWIKIDAENQTHGLSAQIEGEDEVTDVYSDYGDRESIKGDNTATVANFCSVFVNNRDGMPTTAIEIVQDAEIVESVEPFDFSTLTSAVSSNRIGKSISVYPTVASNILNISSVDDVSHVKIYSLSGQAVYSGESTKLVNVSNFNRGTYIVEVKTVNDFVSTLKFIKK